jgi:hypothetical protein
MHMLAPGTARHDGPYVAALDMSDESWFEADAQRLMLQLRERRDRGSGTTRGRHAGIGTAGSGDGVASWGRSACATSASVGECSCPSSDW